MKTELQRKKRKINGGWIFLGLVLLIYGITGLQDLMLAREAFLLFSQIATSIAPILGLVFFLMLLANIFLTPERTRNYLGGRSGLKGWLLAITGGIFSTGPIYPWFILLGELKQQGMKSSLQAAFLYSRAIKLPLLPLLLHYFGMPYMLILTAYLLCFSVVCGMVTGLLAGDENLPD